MARELSQEELLQFLRRAGGRVTNAALLGHFQRVLREPGAAGQAQERRERFKGFVNAVARVQQEPGGPKYVVLRRRYRDLPAPGEPAGGRGDPRRPGPQLRSRPAAEPPLAPAGGPPRQRSREWAQGSGSAPPSAPSPAPEGRCGRPPPVFRSIRCQLALQGLEEALAGRGSPGVGPSPREEGDRAASPPWGAGPRDPGGPDPQCQPQLRSRGPSAAYCRSQRRAAPCTHHPGRSKSAPGGGRASSSSSSSSEELGDQALTQGQRGRRRRRSRKVAGGAVLGSPGVDAPITFRYLGSAQRQVSGSAEEALPAAQGLPEPRPVAVPLDPKEHHWMVVVAAGSWLQVQALFLDDPWLALQRDFISGYTALHWIAKHGATQVLQDLVNGAQKAGVPLDMNVKSSCGYTPLHLAAIHGHQQIMKLLVEKLNSQVHVRDSSGKRPWQYLSSSTSGEVWQLLGPPKGKTIFPTQPLFRLSSPPRKAKSQEVARSISRKTSLAACLKPQHVKWKTAAKYPALRERGEYSD
ncbi:ankyrin repeat domain-containing protein SOWAHB [Carettochelys insculpta]|uniref:ankyrin repeat domain-containing protein SOWAHB n=1 Tax=Carettochelys insculpta TaxID=44489 RepID=UPI003EBF3D32